MKRKIITIDEAKCTGCGLCLPNCPEGAIQIIDNKARLISDLFCDGLGACIGHCPEGAITIEKREAQPYDEAQTMENIIKAGPNVVLAHLLHLKEHGQDELLQQAMKVLKSKGQKIPDLEKMIPEHDHGKGCPGMQTIDFGRQKERVSADTPTGKLDSELGQWPIQLKLLNPAAPYFRNAELVIAADCVPFAYADFHRRFLKGRILIILCPKLDDARQEYQEKLTEIFKNSGLKSITVVHMEVPCCFGTMGLVEEALKASGKNITVKEYTISLRGEMI